MPPEETEETQNQNPEHEVLSTDKVKEILNFDPFADGMEGDSQEGAEETETGEEETGEEGTGEEGEEGSQSAEGEGAGEREEVAPQQDATAKAIQEQTELIRQQMARQLKPQKGEEQPKDPIPEYLFNLDDALINAIRSEDPSHTRLALQHIIKEIGRIVHTNVREEYRPYVTNHVNTAVQRYYNAQKTQHDVEADFYGKFPELNTPFGRSLVVAAANEVMKESPDQQWSAAMRDKIAAVAKENARSIAGPPAGGQTPAAEAGAEQNTQKSKRKVPVQTTPSTRPAPQRSESQADEVVETLFGSG